MKPSLMNYPTIPYAEEWKRTNPDLKVYVPGGENTFDAVNQHFLVSATQEGTWFATWTRSADEGFENQHIACSRSEDRGWTWSRPVVIDGPEGAEDRRHQAVIQSDGNWVAPKVEKDYTGIASWCFPVFAYATGRIYVFYNKCIGRTDFRYDMSGAMCMRYSEDDGKSWSEHIYQYPIESKAIDHPDPTVNKNWIVWTQPMVTSKGNVIAPYSRWSSPKCGCPGGSESFFFHFENILTEPDPEKFRIVTYPREPHGLRVPACERPATSWCEEPIIVELSDGRLFCIMRTDHGVIYSSISSDQGKTWTPPIPLMNKPAGDFLLNPVVPCPIYKLRDGRYLLLYYHYIPARGETGRPPGTLLPGGTELHVPHQQCEVSRTYENGQREARSHAERRSQARIRERGGPARGADPVLRRRRHLLDSAEANSSASVHSGPSRWGPAHAPR